MPEPIVPLKLVSLLLQYPSAPLQEACREIGEDELGGLGSSRPGVWSLVNRYGREPLGGLQRDYVETFDFRKQHALYMTYHLHGDRRQRGVALLRIKQAYTAAGLELETTELPDFLPLMLEFATLAPGSEGRDLLGEHRVAIELVRAGLHRDSSDFAPLLDAVVEGLPGMSRRQLSRLKRLAAEGPPAEQVGLEPFAPPEVIPGEDGGGMPLVGGRP